MPVSSMRNVHLHRGRSLVLCLLLSVFACSPPAMVTSTAPIVPALSSTPAPHPAASASARPALTPAPGFEAAPCAFPVPRGYEPACGYLIVPENRARPDSQSIRLHVAVFRNRAGIPNPDPVIKISGGPGSSGLNTTRFLLSGALDAMLESRDFVVFDQRGTGYSRPRLDCPERVAITPALLRGRLSADESAQAILDAFQRCRKRLMAEGIDLSAYHSAASAADIDDLRTALGYEQWNIYAISYGTRLALTLMRDHPGTVRSAVLDSVYPLQVNLYTTLASNAERAFNLFFERCAADPDCGETYPDLRAVFYRLVDDLNARPVRVSLFVEDGKQSVRVDGGVLLDVLFSGLYSPALRDPMPQMIYEVRKGNYTLLGQRLELYFDSSNALGMQMAVQCAEEIPFGAPEDAYAAAQGLQPQLAAFFPQSVRPLFAVCKEWSAAPPDPRENLPVRSDVPALVLAGEGDPITPPAWGRMVAEDLSHAYFYEVPGAAHWVFRSSDCAVQMALAFWEHPAEDPGEICR